MKPKIRLSNKHNAWESHTLSQIAKMHARIGWQNLRKEEFQLKGDYYLITGTDFSDGLIDYDKCHYISEERYNQDKNIQLSNGSILITKDGTLGKVAYIDNLNKPATLNAGVFNVICKNGIVDSRFLFHYLKSPFLMNYVTSTATGGTIKHLNQNILVNFPINMPDYDEQEFLGSLFHNLDSIIRSTAKKIESLKKVKAASLQSMFPQEGETTPRIRFKRFGGEWEKCKLGDVLEYEQPTNYLVSDTEYSDQGTAVLTAGKTFILGYTNECSGIYENLPAIIFDDFTTDSKFVDFPFKVKSSAMKILKCRNCKYNIKYIFEAMNRINFVVGNHQRHWISSFSKFEIPVPCIEEQNAIASYFINLDKQIDLQTQRLEKLKQIKAACLDNMFV